MNISSYSREFRTESKNGPLLLKDLSVCKFIKLKELNLQYCNINDLSPLTSDTFKDLVFLNLQYNSITNLSALKNIKFLDIREMYFGLNSITDISPLENIPFRRLSVISFAGNKIVWNEETKRIYDKIIKK